MGREKKFGEKSRPTTFRLPQNAERRAKLRARINELLKEEAESEVKREEKTQVTREAEKWARNQMSKKEIYEEFWEFIDDDNEEFQEFITRDDRRRERRQYAESELCGLEELI